MANILGVVEAAALVVGIAQALTAAFARVLIRLSFTSSLLQVPWSIGWLPCTFRKWCLTSLTGENSYMVGIGEVLCNLFQQVLGFKNMRSSQGVVKLIEQYWLHSFDLHASPRETMHDKVVDWRVLIRPLFQFFHQVNVHIISGMLWGVHQVEYIWFRNSKFKEAFSHLRAVLFSWAVVWECRPHRVAHLVCLPDGICARDSNQDCDVVCGLEARLPQLFLYW